MMVWLVEAMCLLYATNNMNNYSSVTCMSHIGVSLLKANKCITQWVCLVTQVNDIPLTLTLELPSIHTWVPLSGVWEECECEWPYRIRAQVIFIRLSASSVKRYRTGERWYQVKWLSFDNSHNSWMKFSDLDAKCQDVITRTHFRINTDRRNKRKWTIRLVCRLWWNSD